MAVYVDDAKVPFGRMVMCHLVADSAAELRAMADAIGVSGKWLQHAGTHREHFDICLSKRKLAVEAGAVEVTRRELGRIVMEQRRKRACQMKTKR